MNAQVRLLLVVEQVGVGARVGRLLRGERAMEVLRVVGGRLRLEGGAYLLVEQVLPRERREELVAHDVRPVLVRAETLRRLAK